MAYGVPTGNTASTVCYGLVVDQYSDDGCLRGFGETAGIFPSVHFRFPRANGDRYYVEIVGRGSIVLADTGWAETKVRLADLAGTLVWE